MAEQRKREFRRPREEVKDEFDNRMLGVRRVAKVVKGGRTLRSSALVVVGDRKGRVGMGLGKSNEMVLAIDKAKKAAKNYVLSVRIINGRYPHEIIVKFQKTKVKI